MIEPHALGEGLMGTDLETTLEELQEFKNQVDYWFSCSGIKEDSLTSNLLAQLELRLRDLGEKHD